MVNKHTKNVYTVYSYTVWQKVLSAKIKEKLEQGKGD